MLTYYIPVAYVSIIKMLLPNYKYILTTNVINFQYLLKFSYIKDVNKICKYNIWYICGIFERIDILKILKV
jgi:hypothetical protein